MEPVDIRERVVPAEAELTRVPASEYRSTSRCDAGVTRLLGQRTNNLFRISRRGVSMMSTLAVMVGFASHRCHNGRFETIVCG